MSYVSMKWRILLSSIEQSRGTREKIRALYFSSETQGEGLRLSQDAIPGCCRSFTHYLWGHREAAYAQLLNVFCSFSAGRMGLMLSWQCVLFSLLLFLFTCLLTYLLFAFSLPWKWFWELYGGWTIPTNKSLCLFSFTLGLFGNSFFFVSFLQLDEIFYRTIYI
jgi:hypothetical protein